MDLYIGHDLKTEQTQQLALTPEMVQSLNILKFSGEELLDYIFDALDENPVLDINEDDMKDRQLVAASAPSPGSESSEERFEERYENDGESGGWDSTEWYDYAEFSGGTAPGTMRIFHMIPNTGTGMSTTPVMKNRLLSI